MMGTGGEERAGVGFHQEGSHHGYGWQRQPWSPAKAKAQSLFGCEGPGRHPGTDECTLWL